MPGAPTSGAAVTAPLAALDRVLASPSRAAVRVMAWAAANYLLLLVATVAGYVLVALPPLSLLPSRPSDEGYDLSLVALVAVFYGSFGWPVHLGVVAAVSRARRARLWVLVASPLLSVAVLGLPYLGAVTEPGLRAAVLAWTLYALVCRLMPPARRPSAAPAGRPAR